MSARDPAPFEGFDQIPDPAAAALGRAAPEASPPAAPSLTRADRKRRSILVAALAVGWVMLVTLRLGIRADIQAIDVAVPIVLWVVLAVLGVIAALRPRDRGLPPAAPVVQIVALVVPLLFLGSALIASHDAHSVEVTWRNSGSCVAWASITAVGPFLLAGLLLQRSFLSAPVWRGAAVGAVCGLCAAAGIHAHCSVAASAHVILAHGFPVVSGGLLGALFGALRGRA